MSRRLHPNSRRWILTRAFLAAGLPLGCESLAHAQDELPADGVGTPSASATAASPQAVITSAGQPDDIATLPATVTPGKDKFEVDRFGSIGAECGSLQPDSATSHAANDCPFARRSFGMKASANFEAPIGNFTTTVGFARGSDAALSLDRQMVRTGPALVRETTLSTVVTEAKLFGGRMQLSSAWSWSRDWARNLVETPYLPARTDEHSGVSQNHNIALTLVDQPDLDWKLLGALSRSDDDFRGDNAHYLGPVRIGQGNYERVSTRARLGAVRLGGSLTQYQTAYSRRNSKAVSIEHSGIQLNYRASQGRTFAHEVFTVLPSQSRTKRLSLDFDLFALAPTLSSGWGSLLPQQLTLSTETRKVLRPQSRLRRQSESETLGIFGMWSTGLGTTVIDYSLERSRNMSTGAAERESQFLINHSTEIGVWKVGLDLSRLQTHSSELETDRTFYYDARISRTFAGGVQLSMSLGRDTVNFGGAASEFVFADKSDRAKVKLDLSTMVQRRLENPSMHLTLEAQMRLNRSETELRFFDEVVALDRENYARQGILVSFGFVF